jgi:hypothetical protein
MAYDAFVTQEIKPWQLCYSYYFTCLRDRGLIPDTNLPTDDKQKLYDILCQ